MNNIVKAFVFAAATLLVAWLGRAGLITQDMSRTLVIVLPVLAVTSLVAKGRCNCLRTGDRA